MNKPKVIDKSVVVPFAMLVSCFALWGLLNNMTDNLVPAFGKIFMMDSVNSSLVQVSFYAAYAVLAIPAALIIKKFSYRAGVLVGLGFYMIGAMGYVPAAMLQNYNLFLVSIFVMSCGLSVLETTCSPYIISLGDHETSIQRLNFAQAFNPLGSLAGIFLAKYLILAHLNEATYAERIQMPADQLAAIRSGELIWVCVPYVGLIVIALIIWIFFFTNKRSYSRDTTPLNVRESFRKLKENTRYFRGVIAQFFYVGVQISVWTWTIKYAMTVFGGMNEATAAKYYLFAIVLFIVCRWICTGLLRKFNPARMLSVFAAIGILCCLGTVYLPASVSIWTLVAISGCMSLMFPTIYGIALYGMGDEVKLGAAGLVMAILGGAIITPVMGKFIDGGYLSFLSATTGVEAAMRTSFFIPVICFAVVLAYGLFILRKNRVGA